jgi:hypothetical protein
MVWSVVDIDFSISLPTSREKAIPGAPKWLIPGAFRFASDLYAGGNAYRWRILQFTGDNFFYRWRIWYVRRG